MYVVFTAFCGHSIQVTLSGPMVWPSPMSVLATRTWVVLVVTSSLTTLVGFLTRLITPKNAPSPHTPAIATPSSCARFIARQPLSAENQIDPRPQPDFARQSSMGG